MSQPAFPRLEALAGLDVRVLFRRVPTSSRWQPFAWRVEAVVPADPSVPPEADTGDRVAGAARIEIHRDEAEGYYLNVSSAEPSIFVLWRPVDEESPDSPPAAHGVTLGYNEAARWMDGGETVERVPMPAEMVAWLTDFVNRAYEPEQRRKRRGAKPSFMSREEFDAMARAERDGGRAAPRTGGGDHGG